MSAGTQAMAGWLRAQRGAFRLGARLGAFADDTSAATAIEYAIIGAGVGATVAGIVYSLGEQVDTLFYDRLLGLFSEPGSEAGAEAGAGEG